MTILLREAKDKDKSELVVCDMCNNLISPAAELCMHCGNPDQNELKYTQKNIQYIQIILIFSAVLLVLYLLSRLVNH